MGAAVWTVAVLAKFAIAIPLNKPILEGLKDSLPQWAYLTVGTIYGGTMTGITEIVFTLFAALIWRRMTTTAACGVANGVGAGAFEAALIAITVAVTAVTKGVDYSAWPVALAPAVDRLLAILCHTASRALVLLAVAKRRWVLFGYGFLLLSLLDAIAAILHLTGQVGTMSPWMTEALLAPVGLVSIPITAWCIRHWPAEGNAAGPQAPQDNVAVSS